MGSHVVIELLTERKIAGHLQGGSQDEGVLLSVTHKDSELVRRVSDAMVAEIAAQLEAKSIWWLRAAMALRGHFAGVTAPRQSMISQLQYDIEADLLEQSDDGVQFRELKSPVLTYIAPGAIMLMEVTEDKLRESEISVFDQTLDEALEKILTDGEQTTKDDDGGNENEGNVDGSLGSDSGSTSD